MAAGSAMLNNRWRSLFYAPPMIHRNGMDAMTHENGMDAMNHTYVCAMSHVTKNRYQAVAKATKDVMS